MNSTATTPIPVASTITPTRPHPPKASPPMRPATTIPVYWAEDSSPSPMGTLSGSTETSLYCCAGATSQPSAPQRNAHTSATGSARPTSGMIATNTVDPISASSTIRRGP